VNTEDINQDTDVAILGGGLAGLSAADSLARKGKDVLLIEKESCVGGMSRSVRHKDFVFDLGGHRFLPHNDKTADFVRNLFTSDALSIMDRESKIYLRDKFLQYPPEFFDILKNLGTGTCMKCLTNSILSRIKHVLFRTPDTSLRDWMINRFGHTLFKIYFGPYSYKLWGRATSDISSEWASQRISVPHIGSAIKGLFFDHGNSIKTYAKEHYYPRGGIGVISDNLADRITCNGGRIVTDQKITRITMDNDRFLVESKGPDNTASRYSSSKLISSIPLTEMMNILQPAPPPDILDLVNRMSYRSVRFMNIMIDGPRISDNTWIYVPERNHVFFRIQEFPNWHPDNAPEGKTSLTLEVSCNEGDKTWNRDNDTLFDMCIRDLTKMGIDIKDRTLDHFSTYAEHAYPVYSLQYRERLDRIYDYARTLDNLIICGRQGLFRYINMDRTMESGFDAAEAVHDDSKRRELVNYRESREYLESNIHLRK